MTRSDSSTTRCPGRLSRRNLLASSATGFGMLALAGLIDRRAGAAPHSDGATPRLPFVPKAKRVIFCFMDGGVSHVDSFDPKPKLADVDGQPFTTSINPTANCNRQWLKSP